MGSQLTHCRQNLVVLRPDGSPLEPGREIPNESGLVELGRTRARAESQAADCTAR